MCFLPLQADFGLAQAASKALGARAGGGTPFYMAPEVFSNSTATTAADVYSFGIIAFEVFALKSPYPDGQFRSHDDLKRSVIGGTRPVFPSNLSGGRKEALATSCWQLKPDRRPTIEQVIPKLESLVS